MSKLLWFELLLSAVTGAILAAVLHWAIPMSWSFAALFAWGAVSSMELRQQLSDNRKLFDVADAELVRVSALANRLEEELAELQGEVRTLRAGG